METTTWIVSFCRALLTTVALTLVSAHAQVITFTTATDYNNNFRETAGAASMTYDATVPSLRFTQSSSTTPAVTIYDTTPADSAVVNTFTDSVISVNFRLSQADDSIGILTRLSGANNSGYLAIVNLRASAGATQLRLFDGADITGAAGTQVAGVNSVAGNLLSTTSFYSLRLSTVNVGGNVQLTASIFNVDDFSGAPLYTVSYLDTTAPYTQAGQIGLRFGANGSTQSLTDVTSYTIDSIPEPSTSLFFGIGLLALIPVLRRPRNT